jgi:SAGA-associated factor 29
VESQQAALIEAGKLSDIALDERLEKLYRDNVKLCEDVQHIIEGKSNDTNLLDSITILAGLREASEESAAQMQSSQGQRMGNGKLSRAPKKVNNKPAAATVAVALSTEDGDDASAAASPRVNLGSQANRLGVKDKTSRSGSIATTREASVKIEDGAESVASSTDGVSVAASSSKTSLGNRPSNRLVLRLGEKVFCRHDPKSFDSKKKEQPEGEGILCKVTNVIGEGKQRRYEVQDVDNGDASPPQRASVQQLIQIPESNKGLGDLTKGKHVLAQYPDTTTFYKAEVFEAWKAKEAGNTEKGEWVRLNFEDDGSPREVERRFVLSEK